MEHSIENVYYVNGLKYSLLSVSQTCDTGNEIKFQLENCTVTNMISQEVILVAKKVKNMYGAYFDYVQSNVFTCVGAQSENAELWHKWLDHVSPS